MVGSSRSARRAVVTGVWITLVACAQKPPPVLRPGPPQPEAPAAPVDPRGVWTGTLTSPSGPVPLRIEVTDEKVPVVLLQDQRFTGQGSRTGNQVQWQFAALGVAVRGSLDRDHFRGRFEQLGRSVPLELTRVKASP